ncbi:MAG: tetratricopeptide repeat protein [Bacteroidota bacterium]
MKSFSWIVLLPLLYLICTSCDTKKKTGYGPVPNPDTASTFLPTSAIPDSLFLGDQACKKCHQTQFKDWRGSHHDKAMQVANDSTVLAPFNGERFTSQGVTSHFFQKEGGFYVNTEGPDGAYHDYEVVYAFGITPLQQYIVSFPKGRYQCLRTAWDTQKNKWFDLYPDFKVVHSEWLHWSRGGLNWNNMCADCHSTNVRKNYDTATQGYDTRYALINVSCEACHGPGKEHAKEALDLGKAYQGPNTMQMTKSTSPKELVDQCARCHMRREQISDNFNFQGTLLDHYVPALITDGTYHPDGQILDEDYVYGSFVQSKMYHNNVTCTNCHNPHSLQLRFSGNQLCTQCHVPDHYDTAEHHFHKLGSEGSKCIECHMTGKVYMGNDFRRDHSFRIPRPDQSLAYDTPNACTECHTDKDNEWAWNMFKGQYGVPDYQHFSDLLAPGLRGETNGKESLLQLIRDTLQPEIARASAVRAIRDYIHPNDIADLLRFLKDTSPLVAATTVDVLGQINPTDYATNLLPLLKHQKRTVRINAFYAIAALTEFQIPEPYKEVYKRVKKEFFTSLDTTSDFAGGLAKKADYYIRKGDIPKAMKNYEKALRIDPLNNMIRTNLANLFYGNGQLDKAEAAFKTIIAQEPEYGPTYYNLGLLLAEVNKMDEALVQFEKAVQYMPDNIRAYYNLSLLYDKKGQIQKAKKTVFEGLNIAPENEDLLYTLVYLYSKNGEMQKALIHAQKLVEIAPTNPQYETLLQQLQSPGPN